MKRFCAIIVAASGVLSAAPVCPVLAPDQIARIRVSAMASACFWVTVETGRAAQLTAEQPVDMALRSIEGGVETLTDGFEFGSETLTIVEPGRYRVDVRPVDAPAGTTWTLSMSRSTVPLQRAVDFRRAEVSATMSKRTGKPDEIARSLQLWKDLSNDSAIARTYLKQGDASLAGDDSLGARTAYEEALRICDALADSRCMAEAANNSGYAASLMGDLEASSRRLREAAAYWRRVSLRLFEGRTLCNLGFMLWQSGDFEQAIKVLDEARRILSSRDASVHAVALNNLGLCYQSLFENDRALVYFQSAAAVFLQQKQRRWAVRARLNVGRSYMLLGKLDLARAILEEALSETAGIGDASGRADVLNNLGQVLLRLHRGDQARASFTVALNLQRSVHSKRGEAIALHYLGVDASARGDAETGRNLLLAAAQIRRESGLRDDASESIFALAELEYKAGNLVAARDLAGQAIALIESLRSTVPGAALRATYYARKRRFFDLLTEIDIGPTNRPNAAAGFLASELARGRSLLDLLTGGGIVGVIPRELVDRRANLRTQINVLSVRLTEADPSNLNGAARRDLERNREVLRSRIQLLLAEDDQVDAEIRQAVHASTLGHPLQSVSELQAALPADTAVLEYYLGERESYLWFVQPDRILSFRLPERSAINGLASRTVNRFGAILDRRRSPQLQAAFEADLGRLSAILLGPLTGIHLPTRLVLVLDGVLNRVPMAALRPPWSRESFGLTYDLIQAPSAAYVLASKPPQAIAELPISALVIADPVFGADDPRVTGVPPPASRPASLSRLPFTGDVAALNSLVPSARIRVLRGFDATPPVLRKMNLREIALLHFSTHAFIDDRIPELSYVALSLVDHTGRRTDGYLHPYQFAEFRLNRSIVVLSSCETALGKEVLGEGLVGFANGLFAAGAAQLVLALTKIDAESSAAFFAEAYKGLFSARSSGMERAVAQARRTLAKSTRWSDPYYWASFTVMGSLSAPR
jgi:tetratricopeptide (TPR) repeat protein